MATFPLEFEMTEPPPRARGSGAGPVTQGTDDKLQGCSPGFADPFFDLPGQVLHSGGRRTYFTPTVDHTDKGSIQVPFTMPGPPIQGTAEGTGVFRYVFRLSQ
jgi:hypothetical protein